VIKYLIRGIIRRRLRYGNVQNKILIILFQDTYNRIRKNEYHIPNRVGPLANSLIVRLLQVSIFYVYYNIWVYSSNLRAMLYLIDMLLLINPLLTKMFE
jgi:hypothetical protein